MKSNQQAGWLSWNEAFPLGEPVGGTVNLADRVVRLASQAQDRQSFLSNALAEIATEFAAQWAAVRQRSPDWTNAGTWGRPPAEPVDDAFLSEALDRDAAGYGAPRSLTDVGTLVTPLGADATGLLV
ncbi:MAG: hypothetical protein WBC44_03500, partial [Planctomycetaceae bacterium]